MNEYMFNNTMFFYHNFTQECEIQSMGYICLYDAINIICPQQSYMFNRRHFSYNLIVVVRLVEQEIRYKGLNCLSNVAI